MKRSIELIFALLTCASVIAQSDYRPLVEEGKVWAFEANNSSISPDYYTEWVETYSLEGDTVIGTHQCLKLYFTSTFKYQSREHIYQGAMYEEDSKVYYIVAGSLTPKLLYDFFLNKGDIFRSYYSSFEYELTIYGRWNVCYNGLQTTIIGWHIYDENAPSDYSSIWIEGVGSPIDLLDYFAKTGSHKKLATCLLNGKTIYDEASFQVAYAIHDARSVNHHFFNHQYYDLSGRRLANPPARGLYIREGKVTIGSRK